MGRFYNTAKPVFLEEKGIYVPPFQAIESIINKKDKIVDDQLSSLDIFQGDVDSNVDYLNWVNDDKDFVRQEQERYSTAVQDLTEKVHSEEIGNAEFNKVLNALKTDYNSNISTGRLHDVAQRYSDWGTFEKDNAKIDSEILEEAKEFERQQIIQGVGEDTSYGFQPSKLVNTPDYEGMFTSVGITANPDSTTDSKGGFIYKNEFITRDQAIEIVANSLLGTDSYDAFAKQKAKHGKEGYYDTETGKLVPLSYIGTDGKQVLNTAHPLYEKAKSYVETLEYNQESRTQLNTSSRGGSSRNGTKTPVNNDIYSLNDIGLNLAATEKVEKLGSIIQDKINNTTELTPDIQADMARFINIAGDPTNIITEYRNTFLDALGYEKGSKKEQIALYNYDKLSTEDKLKAHITILNKKDEDTSFRGILKSVNKKVNTVINDIENSNEDWETAVAAGKLAAGIFAGASTVSGNSLGLLVGMTTDFAQNKKAQKQLKKDFNALIDNTVNTYKEVTENTSINRTYENISSFNKENSNSSGFDKISTSVLNTIKNNQIQIGYATDEVYDETGGTRDSERIVIHPHYKNDDKTLVQQLQDYSGKSFDQLVEDGSLTMQFRLIGEKEGHSIVTIQPQFWKDGDNDNKIEISEVEIPNNSFSMTHTGMTGAINAYENSNNEYINNMGILAKFGGASKIRSLVAENATQNKNGRNNSSFLKAYEKTGGIKPLVLGDTQIICNRDVENIDTWSTVEEIPEDAILKSIQGVGESAAIYTYNKKEILETIDNLETRKLVSENKDFFNKYVENFYNTMLSQFAIGEPIF